MHHVGPALLKGLQVDIARESNGEKTQRMLREAATSVAVGKIVTVPGMQYILGTNKRDKPDAPAFVTRIDHQAIAGEAIRC